jgi:site-specific recombinase XerC
LQLQTAHIRRFVAQMHGAGRSGRGIALILSGWRGFYVWAGRQGLVGHNPVQDVRAPKAPKPLPKALGVDDAVRLAALEELRELHSVLDTVLSQRRRNGWPGKRSSGGPWPATALLGIIR